MRSESHTGCTPFYKSLKIWSPPLPSVDNITGLDQAPFSSLSTRAAFVRENTCRMQLLTLPPQKILMAVQWLTG